MEQAKGQFMIFMSENDRLTEDALVKMIAYL